jgi:Zn-dependent metalloprotease
VAASLFCVDTAQAVPYRAAISSAQALKTLQLTAGNQAFVSTLPDDRFTAVKAPVGKVIAVDNASAPALTRALAFLAIHGAAMGVQNPAAELKWVRTSTDAKGGVHVHMEQMHEGLHVFGARLIVHMNEQGITGVNGVFLPDASEVSTTPSQTFEALRERAFMAAGKLHPKVPRSDLRIESSRLVIYNTGLLQSLKGGNRLAYDVVVKGALGGEPVREQLFIDANSGLILNRINRIETVLHRKTYTPVYGNALVYEDGKGPTSVPPVAPAPTDPPFTGDTTRTTPSTRPNYNPPEALHLYAGGTWKMYKLMLGRDGYNEDGPKPIPATGMVQESVYLVNNNCPNAYWDGTAASYCPGFDLDDVVSHEWSHAYTEYMDGLIYSYQSGALNEAYSDIYGETYDLINGFEGKAGSTLTEGKYYKDGGSRWYVGEDLSDAAASLLLRDMWDPDDFMSPSPGKVGSTNYECGTGDGGGVHTNSGVPNHAYAMLVDGRPNAQDPTTFNNVPVPKIGLFKAAHIFFAAKRDYQTPSTNFPEHADALDMACQDLLGVNVKGLNGQPSGEIVTQADCNAVKQAALSVAYRAPVKTLCNYVPVLLPESSTPALCATGRSPKKIFREGFNQVNFPSNWTKGMELAPVGNTTIANWTLSKNLPAPTAAAPRSLRTTKAAIAPRLIILVLIGSIPPRLPSPPLTPS